MEQSGKLIEIAPHGDVVLVCGNVVKETRIKVLSHILILGSPVFGSMLGPSFREGRTLAAASSIDLPLPEDDPETMKTLCYILNHKNKAVRTVPGAKHILNVILLADKYDCMEAVAHSAQYWIYKHVHFETTNTETLRTLVLAVCYIQDPDLFQHVGRDLIMKSAMRIELPSQLMDHDFPETTHKVFASLEATRQSGFARASAAIEGSLVDEIQIGEEYKTEAKCSQYCSVLGKRFYHLVQELRTQKLWRVNKLALKDLASTFKTMQELQPSQAEWVGCKSQRCLAGLCPRDYVEFSARLKDSAEKCQKAICNICYECAKIGWNADSRQCDHKP